MTQRPGKPMTPDIARKILKEIGQPAEYDWVDGERHSAAAYAIECMDELRRFREREARVWQLIEEIELQNQPGNPEVKWRDVTSRAWLVRDFKVSE